jgi:hypothetical protein
MGLRVASSCSTSRAGKSGLKKQKLPFSRLAGAAGLKCGDQRDAHLFDDRGGAVVGELGFGGGEVGGERLVVEDTPAIQREKSWPGQWWRSTPQASYRRPGYAARRRRAFCTDGSDVFAFASGRAHRPAPVS